MLTRLSKNRSRITHKVEKMQAMHYSAYITLDCWVKIFLV